MTGTIKVLTGDGVLATKDLWKDVFREDTAEFVSYYYTYKAPGNKTYVMEEDAAIRAMLHRTPYSMIMRRQKEEVVDYLVGVATALPWRKRGYMKQLLTRALQEMEQEGRTYTFLMPAREEIYTPYGFAVVAKNQSYLLDELRMTGSMLHYVARTGLPTGFWGKQYPQLRLCTVHPANLEELSGFANTVLSLNQDVYTLRSPEYFLRLKREMETEGGDILVFRFAGKVIAYLAYVRPQDPKIVEFLSLPLFDDMGLISVHEGEREAMMARILNLPASLDYLTLRKGSKPVSVSIEIWDPVISSNCGIWRMHFEQTGNRMEKNCIKGQNRANAQESDSEELLVTVSINEWTTFVFGYSQLLAGKIPALENVIPLQGVHLYEQV